MREMSGLEYGYMADELNRLLVGKHFQKFQKVAEGIYRLRFEKFDVVCELGRRMHITSYLEEAEQSDNFVQKVRKELDSKRLVSVRQLNNDRLIEFSFGEFALVFEMFKKGNALLVKDGKIAAVLKEEKWAGREVRVNTAYLMPPAPPADLAAAISEKAIITALIKLSLGKEYALEILRRSNIDEKAAGKSLSPEQLDLLKQQSEEMKKNAAPLLFIDGKASDYGLTQFADKTAEKCSTLSEAADRFYWENKGGEQEPEELGKLRNRLGKQEEYLLALQAEEQQCKAVGDWFYANYEYAEKLIQAAKKLGVNNLGKLAAEYEIKEIDKEKKGITIEVQ
ncbi:MAG: NFACT family protein [Candidatus Micrarchaeota archaeon]